MSDKKKESMANADFQKVQIRVLFIYIVIIFIVVISITAAILSIAGEILTQNANSLISANCRQIEMNISKYFYDVETTSTLLFAETDYYLYDATDERLDEYSKIKKQENISNRITDLALMKNFSDFAAIYSNGTRSGWVSNTVSSLYSAPELYEQFSATITNDKRNDGWSFGIGDTKDRMYYVKRLNDNAVLMVAFYSRELENVFEFPEELDGMSISLINDDNVVLYSLDDEQIGTVLDERILNVVNDPMTEDEEYIVNVNTCDNGWRVVCAVPKSQLFKGYNELAVFAIILSAIFGILFVCGGIFLMRKTVKPFDSTVSSLEEKATRDRLTGLYNKLAFQDVVSQRLRNVIFGETQVFIMLDMDNFKTINDTLGHSYGDNVLERLGKLLYSHFADKFAVGRLGGDEFALYCGYGNNTPEDVKKELAAIIDKLREDFFVEFAKERKNIKVSLSIGICVQNDERRFEELYKHADSALYQSKNGGKDRYTFYETPDKNKEPEQENKEEEA